METNRIIPTPKQGNEELELEGCKTGWKLSDFWKWSTSDLVSNATRGRRERGNVRIIRLIELISQREEIMLTATSPPTSQPEENILCSEYTN